MALTSINDAIAAYNATAKKAMGLPSQPDADTAGGPGTDFAGLVKDGIKSAIDTAKKGEAMSIQGLSGKADIRDVVAAVNNAQLTLQTVVSVRDKVINAYNFIMQMPI